MAKVHGHVTSEVRVVSLSKGGHVQLELEGQFVTLGPGDSITLTIDMHEPGTGACSFCGAKSNG